MPDPEPRTKISKLIAEYLRSPSLRHLRDPYSIDSLAASIVRAVERQASAWQKWAGERESILRASSLCWIPTEDLRSFLNRLPGPQLTTTDVVQRLRAIHEESYSSYPDEDLKDGCLEIYAKELAAGTELPAIVGSLQQYVEDESERRRVARAEANRRFAKEEREALELRFLSGADCAWTPIGGAKDLYTRKNGRAFRLSINKDKRLDLYRIEDVDDKGARVGTYGTRGDATKAVAKLAYTPEHRW